MHVSPPPPPKWRNILILVAVDPSSTTIRPHFNFLLAHYSLGQKLSCFQEKATCGSFFFFFFTPAVLQSGQPFGWANLIRKKQWSGFQVGEIHCNSSLFVSEGWPLLILEENEERKVGAGEVSSCFVSVAGLLICSRQEQTFQFDQPMTFSQSWVIL